MSLTAIRYQLSELKNGGTVALTAANNSSEDILDIGGINKKPISLIGRFDRFDFEVNIQARG